MWTADSNDDCEDWEIPDESEFDDDDDSDGGIAGLAEPFTFENCGVAGDIRHESLLSDAQSVCQAPI